MKIKLYYITLLLLAFLIPVVLSCEREWDNPWDEKSTIDPNAWAPQNLQIEDISITEKKLSWTYSGDDRFEGYKIDRKVSTGNWQLAYASVSKEIRTWNDNQIIPDASLTYSYHVYSFAGRFYSAKSEKSSSSAFPPPVNLVITPNSISSVTLAWEYNSNGVGGFKIDRQVNEGSWEIEFETLNANQTSFADNSVNWPANKYTYRAYAFSGLYNSNTVQSTISFAVSTSSVTNISTTTATSGGNITTQGNYSIIARGVCYGTTPNPDLSGPHTINSSGQGTFTSNITGLTPSMQCNVRAYASNEYGTTYGSNKTFNTDDLAIGDIYAGGIIFYLDGMGGGLVCAESDQSTDTEWGCYGMTIGGTGTVVGTGAGNMAAILTGCSESGIAAHICNDLVLNGYNDWFLPSKDELNLMYQNLKLAGLGGFASNNYWSSSEYSSDGAWQQNFTNGNQDYYYKTSNIGVRAVRAF